VIASAKTLICGTSASFPTECRQNNIAIRHNEHGEREFCFPYYGNRATSDD
jgi:hypothetical protein